MRRFVHTIIGTPKGVEQGSENDEVTMPIGLVGAVVKTLDPSGEGDFTTFAEAFDWIASTHFSRASLVINVADGSHEWGDQQLQYAPPPGLSLTTFKGVAVVSTLVSVGAVTPEAVLQINRGSIQFEKMTLTATTSFKTFALGLRGSYFSFSQADSVFFRKVYDGRAANARLYWATMGQVALQEGSYAAIVFATIDMVDDVSGVSKGIVAIGDSSFELASGCEIKNADTGISNDRSRGLISNTTFTNVTTNHADPINEIQYDGSYLSNGTAALAFKV